MSRQQAVIADPRIMLSPPPTSIRAGLPPPAPPVRLALRREAHGDRDARAIHQVSEAAEIIAVSIPSPLGEKTEARDAQTEARNGGRLIATQHSSRCRVNRPEQKHR